MPKDNLKGLVEDAGLVADVAVRLGVLGDGDLLSATTVAGELLDIVDEEIANEPEGARADMRSAASTMCGRLVDLDFAVRPPKH